MRMGSHCHQVILVIVVTVLEDVRLPRLHQLVISANAGAMDGGDVLGNCNCVDKKQNAQKIAKLKHVATRQTEEIVEAMGFGDNGFNKKKYSGHGNILLC
jgi:hypothetical protein